MGTYLPDRMKVSHFEIHLWQDPHHLRALLPDLMKVSPFHQLQDPNDSGALPPDLMKAT